MGILSTLAKGAGSLLGGDTLKDVGNIIDDLHTSGEKQNKRLKHKYLLVGNLI